MAFLPPTASLPIFFFFNDTATTEIYTLSLHDALPIYRLAADAGFKPGDKVDAALSEATDTRAAGTTLFVTRSGPGASSDPAANRAQMPTQDALAVAPEQQYAAANRSLGGQDRERSQQLAQAHERQQEESGPGPRMG